MTPPSSHSPLRLRAARPEDAAALLGKLRESLAAADAFDAAACEAAVREFTEAEGVKIGQVIHALRVAVTGKAVGFGMWETLAVLGRERSLNRIDRALARVADPSEAT